MQLSHNGSCVQEYERVVAGIPAAAKPLLRPHLEDLDAKLKPGAFVLTWVSLNIDGYLHNLHQASTRSGTLCRLCRLLM